MRTAKLKPCFMQRQENEPFFGYVSAGQIYEVEPTDDVFATWDAELLVEGVEITLPLGLSGAAIEFVNRIPVSWDEIEVMS